MDDHEKVQQEVLERQCGADDPAGKDAPTPAPEREPISEEASEPTPLLSQGADEFLSGEIKPVEWAIEDIWPVGNSGPIGGPEKTGKTWLAHEIALSLSTATPFLGTYRVPRPFRVLYWEEEDSRERTRRRGLQMLAGRNRPMPSPDHLRYLVGYGLKIDDLEGEKVLREEIEQFRPEFVIVGNLREIHSKDENRSEMAQIRDAFRTLSRESGCGFILIHHFRKSQADQSRRGSQMLAGSGVWGAWAEAWMWVTPGATEDLAQIEVGSKDATGVGKLVVQRRDVTDGDPLAEDGDGRKVWPVILDTKVERYDRAFKNKIKIAEAVFDYFDETGNAITVKELEKKTGLSRRTIVTHLPEVEEAGVVQRVKLHGNAHGYLP